MNIVINISKDIFTDIKEVDFDSARNIVRNYQATIADAIRNGTTEHKVGKWIRSARPSGLNGYECSQCGSFYPLTVDLNYCPNCGAEMVGAENEYKNTK